MSVNNSSPLGLVAKNAVQVANSIFSQVATKYWLEVISIPAGNNTRLWLFASGQWNHMSATPEIVSSVQSAFANGSNMEVVVWTDATNAINGLVVRTP